MLPFTSFAILVGLHFCGPLQGEEESSSSPLQGWTSVAILPEADISIVDGETSSTDKEALVDSLIKVLEDQGISARTATADDKRRIKLSINVMRGRSASFVLRIQHQEPATFEREGIAVSGLATTWEAETVSEFDFSLSTQRTILEEAMTSLAQKLAEAIGVHTSSKPAEQVEPLKR